MRRRTILLCALCAIGAVPFLWGCSSKEDQGTIRIGVLTPLTGDVASWGDMQRKSTDLALEEINRAGGIHGRKVEVIYEDCQATPKIGLNAFTKLVDIDKVQIVVGSPASGVTLAIAPVANERKVVLLSSGSTATAVGEAGPYVFRIMPSDEVQAKMMAEWAVSMGLKRVGVIYVQNAWGQGLKDAFERGFKALGGTITTSEGTTQESTDYRGPLSKIAASGADAIYAPLYSRGGGLMARQARELGLKQQILGADVYATPEYLEVGQNAVEGVLFTRFGSYDGPEYKEYAKTYKDKYGREPEAYATYCYDAFKVALKAIAECPAGEVTGEHIRKALLAIKGYQGATGETTFDGRNSATGKTFERLTIRDGKVLPWKGN